MITDAQIETVLARAIRCENVDLVDACETALKMIVQPNLKRQAIDRIIAEQRALGWPDFHPEDYCHMCGVAFEPWFTDRETWLVGTAKWSAETGREGICCVTCFAAMYRAATGTSPTWRLSL